MGHPIDPDDPPNGGCPLCVHYVPRLLHMTFVWKDGDVYQGFIHRHPIEFHLWRAPLSCPGKVDRVGGIILCYKPNATASVQFYGAAATDIENIHCTLPIAGQNEDGYRFLITVDQPDP